MREMATHHQQILALVVTRTYIYTQAYISVIGAHTTCHVTTWPADNMTFGFDLQEARAMIDEAQAAVQTMHCSLLIAFVDESWTTKTACIYDFARAVHAHVLR